MSLLKHRRTAPLVSTEKLQTFRFDRHDRVFNTLMKQIGGRGFGQQDRKSVV